jgi:ankyrin repeat protein
MLNGEATNKLNDDVIHDNSIDMDSLSRDICRQIEAANWEQVQTLLTLVPEGQLLPVHIVAAKQTALHLAIENNVEPVILQGLVSVMDMNQANQQDKFGNTPLHLCCRRGMHLQSLALIAEAWPNAALQENVRGHIPFDDLFLRDDEDGEKPWDPVDATSLLLDACPHVIDHLDRGGQNLLHRILKHGATEEKIRSIPQALLRRKPEFAHAVDNHLVTPLHEACKREDSLPIVQDLMAQLSREQWMVQDDEGRTVLHYAVYWGAPVEIVQELVRASHDLIHVKDLSGDTPMDYLLSFYSPDFTSNSIQVGWDSFVDNIVDMVRAFFVDGPHRDKTRLGELYLHAALYTRDCPIPIIEFLVVAAPDHAEEYDEVGNLPIHLASQLENIDEANLGSYVEVISELVGRFPEGARAPNPDGLLPLKLMINAGHTWEYGIQTLIEAHPAAICDECLEPYCLTTLLSRLDHDSMYRLLQEAPFLMESGRAVMNPLTTSK